MIMECGWVGWRSTKKVTPSPWCEARIAQTHAQVHQLAGTRRSHHHCKSWLSRRVGPKWSLASESRGGTNHPLSSFRERLTNNQIITGSTAHRGRRNRGPRAVSSSLQAHLRCRVSSPTCDSNFTNSSSSAIDIFPSPDDKFRPWFEFARHCGRVQAKPSSGEENKRNSGTDDRKWGASSLAGFRSHQFCGQSSGPCGWPGCRREPPGILHVFRAESRQDERTNRAWARCCSNRTSITTRNHCSSCERPNSTGYIPL